MATKAIIKVKTFQIIVLQDIVDSLPWTAMVFFTMWFELIGFDHNYTAALPSLFVARCALGSLPRGVVVDRMHDTYLSPLRTHHVCIVQRLHGHPILLVPPQSDTTIRSFLSFAAPLVGILSEKMFGYDSKSIDPVKVSAREALTLSWGLLAMMALPFGLCSLFYSPLYKYFKEDRENARMASSKEVEVK